MTNQIQTFNFEASQVRTVVEGDDVLFVAMDVCTVLGIDRTQVRRIDEDEKGVREIHTPGGLQNMTVLTESGLYALIVRSDKPSAKVFRKWVTSEVLPSIRKTGSYQNQSPELQIAHAMLLAGKMIEEQKQQILEMKPKADFFDAVTESKDAIDIGTVAKVLNAGIGRTKLFEFLRDEQILMGNNQPYQKYIDCGYFRIIEQKWQKPDGSTHVSFKTVVYQKGVDFIRRKLGGEK